MPYRYAAEPIPTVSGTGPFRFTVAPVAQVPLPSGMTVDEETGAFSWKPTSAQRGFHLITLRAIGPGGEASQTFTVAVECSDEPPLNVGCGCTSAAEPMAVLLLLGALRLVRRRRA